MSEFWKLLKESVIVQGIVTLALIVTVCVMVASEKTVPDNLWYATFAVLGFWFGSKVQNAIRSV